MDLNYINNVKPKQADFRIVGTLRVLLRINGGGLAELREDRCKQQQQQQQCPSEHSVF